MRDALAQVFPAAAFLLCKSLFLNDRGRDQSLFVCKGGSALRDDLAHETQANTEQVRQRKMLVSNRTGREAARGHPLFRTQSISAS